MKSLKLQSLTAISDDHLYSTFMVCLNLDSTNKKAFPNSNGLNTPNTPYVSFDVRVVLLRFSTVKFSILTLV